MDNHFQRARPLNQFNAVAHHNSMFKFDREYIEAGCYVEQRQGLKEYICQAVFYVFLDAWIIASLSYEHQNEFDIDFSARYVVQKAWMIIWIIT